MTPPLISVIIPTKNSEQTIEKCLQSIKNQTYQNIEIIVVDNDSTDDTKNIALKYTNKVFKKGPERSAQRNYWVKKSIWEYVLIIDSDMELTQNVVWSLVENILKKAWVKCLVVPEESFGEWFWAKCKKLERSFYIWIDFMEAARFFEKKTFDEFWWYDEDNTWTEDFDLPQRIEFKYWKDSIWRINDLIMHNELKLSFRRTCKKKFYYAQRLDSYVKKNENKSKFSKQSSILTRYILFFKNPIKLFKNPIIWFWMLFLKTSEIFAWVLWYILWKFKKIWNIYK